MAKKEQPLKIHGTLDGVLRVAMTKAVKPPKAKRKKAAKKAKR